MMNQTHLGPKTQLGTYTGNHYDFSFASLANTSQTQSLPNKSPELAAVSKCG